MSQDVFLTPCWNFVGGDRQIEAILREQPAHAPLVVRNRLGHVLATVAGLQDLGRLSPWEPLPLAVRVPENAVAEPGWPLESPVLPEQFFSELLTRVYGVAAAGACDVAPPGGALVAVGYGLDDEAEARRLADWLKLQGDMPVVFVCPPGRLLAEALRPFARTAWSTQVFGGLNAFALAPLEEAVDELAPARLYIAAPGAATLTHTAIGAVDFLLGRLGDPRAAGLRVSALWEACRAPAAGPVTTVGARALLHLAEDLGVVSTAADPRFRVTAEGIAIDLV